MNSPNPITHLGFLTVLQDGGGFLGGYLVTNLWGRPQEFRLSTAVQPNKVQQILYGPTLGAYLSAELIGKTLVEKTATAVQLVLTDHRDVLELRRVLDIPVVWVAPVGEPHSSALTVREPVAGRGPLVVHPDFAVDAPPVAELFKTLGAGLDAAEPFSRIREAIVEARKMGVTHRAAG